MHKILANTIFLGKDLINLTECHSTNEIARNLIKNGAYREGTVVITDKQTRGKGQRNSTWHAATGLNLTFSIILTPGFLPVHQHFYFNMAMANGVLSGLATLYGEVQIKWPNDFLSAEGKKLGGMLIENSLSGRLFDTSVIGIGINVNQFSFPVPNATSLASLTGKSYELAMVLAALLGALEEQYLKLKDGALEAIKRRYLDHLYRLGSWAEYNDGHQFTGKILGVAPSGHLLISKQNGETQSYEPKQIRFI
ncbi:BirA family transcriptional regulator, biotin operon repressor / biotin-[acetyl-CoA-carboxylase] ligase [Cyclobacterium lianum]|uniref:BirA family transcriptional regulator, biotin operon repressor / biotin-[acetyl-CoA-carboxylase] ligase n=1 Tax=Cyclobacterium lianum TaxID=388280 RepID=A0A1M7NWK3_9BACT|nr:biotin--[acetyl-CoA-carboxylase] ligase [Cyclobacterium lianum]SHN08499.1 BirA family transcriptional regulator, biotin operon repressor / biotin-[acetyl-CoA-carboxylase] ligase [Cyclobacterium lianum]